MKAHRLVAIALLTLLPAFAVAADVLPPAQLPESGGRPTPGITPEPSMPLVLGTASALRASMLTA